jgi:hypothetical protein
LHDNDPNTPAVATKSDAFAPLVEAIAKGKTKEELTRYALECSLKIEDRLRKNYTPETHNGLKLIDMWRAGEIVVPGMVP